MSGYKGDSLGKRLTRFRSWLSMASFANAALGEYKGAIVLAGEGGDISVLRSLGFPMESIHAIDLDANALLATKRKYPFCRYHYGDFINEIHNVPKFNMAHLDFCGRISGKSILATSKLLGSFDPDGGVMAITLLKGREKSKGMRKTDFWKSCNIMVAGRDPAMLDHVVKGFKSLMTTLLREQMRELPKKSKEYLSNKMKLACINHLFSEKDGEYINPKHLVSLATTYFNKFVDNYGGFAGCVTDSVRPPKSELKKRNGSLSGISLGRVRMEALTTAAQLVCFFHMYQMTMGRAHVAGSQWMEFTHDNKIKVTHPEIHRLCDSLRMEWHEYANRVPTVDPLTSLTYHSKSESSGGTPFISSTFVVVPRHVRNAMFDKWNDLLIQHSVNQHLDAKNSIAQCKSVVGSLNIDSNLIADMFKMSAGTVRALKAHYTRGTYGEDTPMLACKTASEIPHEVFLANTYGHVVWSSEGPILRPPNREPIVFLDMGTYYNHLDQQTEQQGVI